MIECECDKRGRSKEDECIYETPCRASSAAQGREGREFADAALQAQAKAGMWDEDEIAGLRFVDELPGMGSRAHKGDPRYDVLVENLDRWCEWWGTTPNHVHKTVRTVHRDGVRFEGAVRQGIAYIRAVKA